MNNDIMPAPARLIRTLSEHHWDAALDELEQSNDKSVEAGRVTNLENGEISWIYYLVRNGNRLERHIISEPYNIHEIIIVR